MPVHSGLTGADLHEPKGVAGASLGEVYVADGAGSGDWEILGARIGQGYITGNATATSFGGTGAGEDVIVAFGTGFTSDIATNFTISNAGRFTYTGTQTRNFFVDATINGKVGGAAAREYNYYIAKNGTIITSSISKIEYDGNVSLSHSCSGYVTLGTNDFVELYARAETAATDLTVDTCSIKVVEV